MYFLKIPRSYYKDTKKQPILSFICHSQWSQVKFTFNRIYSKDAVKNESNTK